MEDDDAGLLQHRDDWARAVSCGLNDPDLLIDNDLSICGIVWGDHSGEERDVDGERLLGHGTASADFLPEVFRGRLREGGELLIQIFSVTRSIERANFTLRRTLKCTYDSETASVADRRCKLRVSNPLHTTLNDGDYALVSTQPAKNRRKELGVLLSIPNFRVNSVLKGILRGSNRGRSEVCSVCKERS